MFPAEQICFFQFSLRMKVRENPKLSFTVGRFPLTSCFYYGTGNGGRSSMGHKWHKGVIRTVSAVKEDTIDKTCFKQENLIL